MLLLRRADRLRGGAGHLEPARHDGGADREALRPLGALDLEARGAGPAQDGGHVLPLEHRRVPEARRERDARLVEGEGAGDHAVLVGRATGVDGERRQAGLAQRGDEQVGLPRVESSEERRRLGGEAHAGFCQREPRGVGERPGGLVGARRDADTGHELHAVSLPEQVRPRAETPANADVEPDGGPVPRRAREEQGVEGPLPPVDEGQQPLRRPRRRREPRRIGDGDT